MKDLGIIRPIDGAGRIVLPISLRRALDLSPQDDIELLRDGNSIILRKHLPQCTFCGMTETLHPFKGKFICEACAKELKL